jgi:hypothetical protein
MERRKEGIADGKNNISCKVRGCRSGGSDDEDYLTPAESH